jgi:hypothetical protein
MFFFFVRALLATFFYQNLPCDQPLLTWPQMGKMRNMIIAFVFLTKIRPDESGIKHIYLSNDDLAFYGS